MELNQLRIDGLDYDIVFTEEPIIVDNMLCMGSVETHCNRISVDSKLCIDRQFHTLWHEIAHIAADSLYGAKDEEAFCDRFASIIHSIIIDNPDLIVEYAHLDMIKTYGDDYYDGDNGINESNDNDMEPILDVAIEVFREDYCVHNPFSDLGITN